MELVCIIQPAKTLIINLLNQLLYMKLLNYGIIILFSFFACGSGGRSNEVFSVSNDKTSSAEYSENIASSRPKKISKKQVTILPTDTKNIEKIIIKTANVNIKVNDYKTTKPKINELIKSHKAYISSEDERNSNYRISNSITIRVPKSNFDDLIESICKEAKKVESKSINMRDVTEEFLDIETRLKNKKKVENQYLEILKQAKTIEEILKVNEHVRKLREEIESKEGRLKYLTNQVGLSTITLYIYQNNAQAYSSFFEQVFDGFKGGWKGLLSFIIGLVYIWPLILFIIALLWFVKRLIKKRRTKNKKNINN